MKRQDIKKRPLSDTTLTGLTPEAATYREPDGNGLYFKVKPSGHKSWELRHKRPDGKWSWLGLGPYPAVSGALARRKVAELHVQLATGKNPFVSRSERKALELEAARSSFECLGREWHAAREYGWDPGTARRILGALEKHVFPVFGQRTYTSILPMEWMEFFRNLQQTGIIEQSSRIRRYCSEIYDLARVTGRAVHNPVEGLRKFLLTSKKNNYAHVSTDELPVLLRSIRAYPHAPDVRLGLRLLCLLAVRPSELREAQWSEFNFDKKLWTIPAERMKKRREHNVPLSRQALEALKELRPLTGAYPLLFPGRNDHTQPRSETVFVMALRRLGYQGRQTGHGFRHVASTLLNEQGFNPDHIESQLAHVKGGVAGVYNKAQYLEQRATMMQWYADHLDELERGLTPTSPRP